MRPPLPPFTHDTALQKVRGAEDGWNGRNPEKVALAYSQESVWRNRNSFITGRDEIIAFLKNKWTTEQEYRLVKELFAYKDNRIAVRFAYEFRDDTNTWYRAYRNENWVFDAQGQMAERHASINNHKISNDERLFHWPLGPRPTDHASLSDLGL